MKVTDIPLNNTNVYSIAMCNIDGCNEPANDMAQSIRGRNVYYLCIKHTNEYLTRLIKHVKENKKHT